MNPKKEEFIRHYSDVPMFHKVLLHVSFVFMLNIAKVHVDLKRWLYLLKTIFIVIRVNAPFPSWRSHATLYKRNNTRRFNINMVIDKPERRLHYFFRFQGSIAMLLWSMTILFIYFMIFMLKLSGPQLPSNIKSDIDRLELSGIMRPTCKK